MEPPAVSTVSTAMDCIAFDNAAASTCADADPGEKNMIPTRKTAIEPQKHFHNDLANTSTTHLEYQANNTPKPQIPQRFSIKLAPAIEAVRGGDFSRFLWSWRHDDNKRAALYIGLLFSVKVSYLSSLQEESSQVFSFSSGFSLLVQQLSWGFCSLGSLGLLQQHPIRYSPFGKLLFILYPRWYFCQKTVRLSFWKAVR
ncbi:MAG: hypothetical protein Q7I97_03820 [Thermovirgaceae bacterium]|nr:hypothetical protein [Thermovirgaceae bacterium]